MRVKRPWPRALNAQSSTLNHLVSQLSTLNSQLTRFPCFGDRLKPPYIIGAGTHRPVSCYALFKWWLLLSQHPGCLCIPTSFYTEPVFRDLSRGSGLFPSRRPSLSPAVSLPSFIRCHSEFG